MMKCEAFLHGGLQEVHAFVSYSGIVHVVRKQAKYRAWRAWLGARRYTMKKILRKSRLSICAFLLVQYLHCLLVRMLLQEFHTHSEAESLPCLFLCPYH
jgi:hypothetical protein